MDMYDVRWKIIFASAYQVHSDVMSTEYSNLTATIKFS